MKKKIMTLAMVLTLAVSVFAGCGKEKTNAVENPDFGGLTAEYDADTDYDKYAIIEYTFEDLDQTVVVTVSANNDESKFKVNFTFFDEEQIAELTYDGKEYEVTYDKTGFIAKDAPEMCKIAVEKAVWGIIK